MSGAHAKNPHLQHHFESMEQQYESGKLGMWLFLVTEILLFGGLFCAYAVYRANHPEVFHYAHQFLDPSLGGFNTIVLIVSSLTMAVAVRCAQLGQQKALVTSLALTLACAFLFLGVKYVEYQHKWKHGLLWGQKYQAQGHEAEAAPIMLPAAAAPAAPADPEASQLPRAAAQPQGTVLHDEVVGTGEHDAPAHDAAHGPEGEAPANAQLFFGIYFVMTGLHGVHVLAGIAVIFWLLIRAMRGEFGPDYFAPVDFTGLYWHVVDLVWIFLFPLLYLID
ncbi:MAG TPA: cytochrome c oxidase subunit 3 family protein [Candidatus Krumholzibacteria bacterium]|nr:cytochrome c oxidase subunit 3 family protein [Candidatus Krumholzibacteria bacterium]HRX51899.1 cytochrome c oxidase subunit 3 family protein [Candidatus Krumholzibacteria bacterium]